MRTFDEVLAKFITASFSSDYHPSKESILGKLTSTPSTPAYIAATENWFSSIAHDKKRLDEELQALDDEFERHSEVESCTYLMIQRMCQIYFKILLLEQLRNGIKKIKLEKMRATFMMLEFLDMGVDPIIAYYIVANRCPKWFAGSFLGVSTRAFQIACTIMSNYKITLTYPTLLTQEEYNYYMQVFIVIMQQLIGIIFPKVPEVNREAILILHKFSIDIQRANQSVTTAIPDYQQIFKGMDQILPFIDQTKVFRTIKYIQTWLYSITKSLHAPGYVLVQNPPHYPIDGRTGQLFIAKPELSPQSSEENDSHRYRPS